MPRRSARRAIPRRCLMELSAIQLEQQLQCVQREVQMRRRVYPKLVATGRLTQAQADRELHTMQAVAETLARLLYLQPPDARGSPDAAPRVSQARRPRAPDAGASRPRAAHDAGGGGDTGPAA